MRKEVRSEFNGTTLRKFHSLPRLRGRVRVGVSFAWHGKHAPIPTFPRKRGKEHMRGREA
jgi:hypothetical protein